MTKTLAVAILVVFTLLTAGCSSLLPPQAQEQMLTDFLTRPDRYALFSRVDLQSEEKLQLFGMEDTGARFSRQFNLHNPIVGVIERFLDATSALRGTTIIFPEEAGSLQVGFYEPVLFFHSDWHFVYRRLPPSFTMNQLQVGIVAKVIPFGQVLSGRGPTALRTAAWEGSCTYNPFDGKFFQLDDWAAEDGARLRQGIEDAQVYCGEKLSAEFPEQLGSRPLPAVPLSD